MSTDEGGTLVIAESRTSTLGIILPCWAMTTDDNSQQEIAEPSQ
nr:MAG TPA: hypothetical protein [Crassvirales sp.]